MKSVTSILIALPLSLWAIHVYLALFVLSKQHGDAQMITAFMFFAISTVVMLLALPFAVYHLYKRRQAVQVLAVLLNFSWVYYIKVIVFGPTLGLL